MFDHALLSPGLSSFRYVVLLMVLGSIPVPLPAQRIASLSSTSSGGLPDAPSATLSAQVQETQAATGSIGGTVLDITESMVPNAKITLVDDNLTPERTTISDAEGRFSFTALPAGKYKVTITAAGLRTFISNEIVLRPGEHHEIPQFGLPPASDVDVQVTVTQTEIAEEQVTLQEKQRTLGIFPNFYSSYIWDAAPLSVSQKFRLGIRSITDPVIFLATGAASGIEQARNTFPEFGQGTKGYALRYFSGYGDEISSRMFSSAIYPSLFHQDPRYFYRGSGSIRTRFFYAITRPLVTRGDTGARQPNYSRILGALTAGALSNAYHLGNDRGWHVTVRNSSIAFLGNMADNVLREFLFRKLTPNVPDYATGKPETTP